MNHGILLFGRDMEEKELNGGVTLNFNKEKSLLAIIRSTHQEVSKEHRVGSVFLKIQSEKYCGEL